MSSSSSASCCAAASARWRPTAIAAPTAGARRSPASTCTSMTAARAAASSASCAARCAARRPVATRDRAPLRARPHRPPHRPRRLAPPCAATALGAADQIHLPRRGPRDRVDRRRRPPRAGLRLPAGHRQPSRVHRPLPRRLASHADRLRRARRRRALSRQGAPATASAGATSTFVEVERPHRIVEVGRTGKNNRIRTLGVYELAPAPRRHDARALHARDRARDAVRSPAGGPRRAWLAASARTSRAMRRLRAILERGAAESAPTRRRSARHGRRPDRLPRRMSSRLRKISSSSCSPLLAAVRARRLRGLPHAGHHRHLRRRVGRRTRPT